MSQFVLANSVLYRGNVLPAGKIIDSAVYDVTELTGSYGAKLVPFNAATAAQAALLDKRRLRGVQLPLEMAQCIDQVSPFVDPAALGLETDEEILTAGAGLVLFDMAYVSAADTAGRASAADATKVTIGMVRALSGGMATVRKDGEVTGLVGLVPGTTYYLAVAAGGITSVPPSALGQIVQKVGVAVDVTTLILQVDRDFIVL